MAIAPISPYHIPPLPNSNIATWKLETEQAALLIHDMQHYFIAAYNLTAEPIATAIANIQRLRDLADNLCIPVFYSAQPPDQHWSRRGLLSELWGAGMSTPAEAEIITELAPKPQHQIITKWRYSAFERTDLASALRYTKRHQLLITGVYGHMGCMVTAADAFMKDVQPFIIGDAIADFSAEEHQLMMEWVSKRCGVVQTTDQAIAHLTVPQ